MKIELEKRFECLVNVGKYDVFGSYQGNGNEDQKSLVYILDCKSYCFGGWC